MTLIEPVGTSVPSRTRAVVVVGVDGGPSGAAAAREAAAEARRRDGDVVGVHVRIPITMVAPMDMGAMVQVDEGTYERVEEEARRTLAAACDPLGVSWTLEVRDGAVAEELEEAARTHGAAALVVGARHRRRLSLHSCPARELVGRCGTPVHVVEHP